MCSRSRSRRVAAVQGGDVEQQLQLDRDQRGEVGRRQQEAPGAGHPALHRRALAVGVDPFADARLAMLQAGVQQRRRRGVVRAREHRARHPLDHGGDRLVHRLRDHGVDPALHVQGRAVERVRPPQNGRAPVPKLGANPPIVASGSRTAVVEVWFTPVLWHSSGPGAWTCAGPALEGARANILRAGGPPERRGSRVTCGA
jgi:hypothetical protein